MPHAQDREYILHDANAPQPEPEREDATAGVAIAEVALDIDLDLPAGFLAGAAPCFCMSQCWSIMWIRWKDMSPSVLQNKFWYLCHLQLRTVVEKF